MISTRLLSQQKNIMAERNVLLKSLKHPFLVRLHYSFQTAEKLYFVLDYVNGGEVCASNRSKQIDSRAEGRLLKCSPSCLCSSSFTCSVRDASPSPGRGSTRRRWRALLATFTPSILSTGQITFGFLHVGTSTTTCQQCTLAFLRWIEDICFL